MDDGKRLARSVSLCRERGLAMTVQRRAILEELVGRRDHPSADQIFEAVGERLPGLSRTTVYRHVAAIRAKLDAPSRSAAAAAAVRDHLV